MMLVSTDKLFDSETKRTTPIANTNKNFDMAAETEENL
jgi:hypothetical protein